MPPRYLRKGLTKLKPCSEFKVEACDLAPADQCCGALPCTLCLELEVYGEPTTYGTATFGGSSWTGTVGGFEFVSYWERVAATYESDEPSLSLTPTSVQNSVGMSFNLIPGRAYYMETTEVTQAQYLSVMGSNPSEYGEERYDHPVETVSFSDAQRFCARLNARPAEVRAGRTYRIPLEEEWNHAGRAGATTVYYFGDNVADLGDYAWYSGSAGLSHVSVASKPPNAWGLYDIHGNVYEWCFADPPSPGSQRILGGGWYSDADACEFGTTIYADETDKASIIGFRVIMELEPAKAVGECEYIITLDGEEVYRATCYEGASCRDPGGSVGVLIGYDEGTLTWTKHEPRPLAVTTDPDTGCNDFFCGTCRCSCDCLCVTITEPDGTVMLGEICSTSYPCDAPVWEGSIGYYDLSVALGRDDYTGECTISLTASGEDADPVFASGCGNMSASVELYDGTVISVRCKQCSCEETDNTECCDGRPCAGSGEPNAMPSTLTVEVSATFNAPPSVSPPGSGFEPPANSTCFNFSFTIGGGCVEGLKTYGGVGEHSCTWCGNTYDIRLSVVLACGANGWLLTLESVIPAGDCNRDVSGEQFSAHLEGQACNPVLVSGDMNNCLDCAFTCQIGAILIAPGVLVPVIATHSPFCLSFLVYEGP